MKKRTKILVCVLAGIILLAAALCVLCLSRTSGFYSEKQHLSRIQKRAEAHFLGEESEYTSLEVYPLYNEDEKLEYALIELQPQGYMYVHINKSDFFEWLGTASMYTMSQDTPTNCSWTPYRVKDGKEEPFTDENGEPIEYFDSYFKVAGIENERRYILRTPSYENAPKSSSDLIPAVKRGEQYLDLVDGELIDYKPGVYSPTFANGNFIFICKSYFDL